MTLGVLFGMSMLAAAAFAAGRAFIGWRVRAATDSQIDAHHILMGVSMAGMLIPGLGFAASGPSAAIWLVVWIAVTALFAISVIRAAVEQASTGPFQGHHVPHLVMSAAMIYMFAVVLSGHQGHGSGGMSSMSGMSMSGMSSGDMSTMTSGGSMLPPWPTLDAIFLVLMAVYAVLVLDRFALLGAPHSTARVGVRIFLAPRAAAAENVGMAGVMCFMLASMLI